MFGPLAAIAPAANPMLDSQANIINAVRVSLISFCP